MNGYTYYICDIAKKLTIMTAKTAHSNAGLCAPQ